METLHAITELLRLPSPSPMPLGLAVDGDTLWMASRETHRLYAIDIAKWTVSDEVQCPGSPFGMTMVGDELRVVTGYGEKAHDRYIERFIPGHGFKNGKIPCPDLTGSHLAFDGDTLFLSQAHYRKVLALDGQGNVLREIDLPRTPVGMTIVDGCFYLITTDEEFENVEFWILDARGLAFDGTRFWTSHRDNNEIVAFEKS
jgi:sugar lactone lactonase YvrE